MRDVRAVLLISAVMALSIVVIPPQWLFARLWPAAARVFPHLYFRAVTRLMNLRVEIKGTPVRAGPSLYVANHLSWLDILVLSTVRPMCFIAKREVADWPLFGLLATVGRTLYIDRDRRHEVKAACDAIRERLMAGETVVLFPEGTSSDGNRVLPFRSSLLGAADLEVNGEAVLVQPITIAYSGVYGIPVGRVRRPIFAWHGNMQLLPHLLGVGRAGPFEASLTFHPPRTVRDQGSRKALALACEETIRAGLVEALTGRSPALVFKTAETR